MDTPGSRNIDWNRLSLEELFAQLDADAHIDAALAEDLGDAGDVTSAALIEPGQKAIAQFRGRREGRLCGLPLLPMIAARVDEQLHVQLRYADGMAIKRGETFATISGPLRSVLTAERTMLNYLGFLSGIATLTARYVQKVEDTPARIYDTRKTLPGFRKLSKYAVRCGGGYCHRIGLYDAMLVKDNHLAHIRPRDVEQRLSDAIRSATTERQLAFVEIEVDTLDQLRAMLRLNPGAGGGADVILLDNMSVEQLREAVYIRNETGSTVQLEASGGVSLDTVRAIAETGVERIAVGALTHSAPVLDVGLDIA